MFLLQDSTPRIVKFGEYPGCPCGGTHVADVADVHWQPKGIFSVLSKFPEILKASRKNYLAQRLEQLSFFCEVEDDFITKL
jgi:hypothetical protein